MQTYEYIIPLIPSEAQIFTITLPLQNENKRIEIRLAFNELAGSWWMDIFDPVENSPLLCAVPIVTGYYPAENILAPYNYLNLGGCTVIPYNTTLFREVPNFDNLGVEWMLYWGDEFEENDVYTQI